MLSCGIPFSILTQPPPNTASFNDIMVVSVTGAVVTCTFLSGLVGMSGCVVSFGTSPDYLPYTLTSSQSGGSGQSISIPLVINGAPLPPATKYHYEVYLGSQDGAHHGVVVRGSFTTGMPANTNAFSIEGQDLV